MLICSVTRWRGKSPQAFAAAPRQQHPVGEHRGRRGAGAGGQDVADILQQEWLAAGHEDFRDAERRGLLGNAPHTLEPERPARRLGRGADAAIVAT